MMEPGGEPDLAAEPLVAEERREAGVQHLEREAPGVAVVLGEVDRGHSSPADLANHFVRPDLLARGERHRIARHHAARIALQNAAREVVGLEHRGHLRVQVRIAGAGREEEGRTVLGRAIERRLEQRLDLLPALRREGRPAHGSARRSRRILSTASTGSASTTLPLARSVVAVKSEL